MSIDKPIKRSPSVTSASKIVAVALAGVAGVIAGTIAVTYAVDRVAARKHEQLNGRA